MLLLNLMSYMYKVRYKTRIFLKICMFQTSARVRSLAHRLELSLLRLGSLMHARIREIFLGGSKGYNVFQGGEGHEAYFREFYYVTLWNLNFPKGGGSPTPFSAAHVMCAWIGQNESSFLSVGKQKTWKFRICDIRFPLCPPECLKQNPQ